MSQDKDKMLMRIKDVVLLIGAVGGLLVGLGKIFILAEAVKVNAEKVEKIEPEIRHMATKIAVADERWEQIQEQIKAINRKLDRNGRDRDR